MTNVCYVKNILANCNANLYLPNLYLSRVELHCKLQVKLHRVTGPLKSCIKLNISSMKLINLVANEL